MSTNEPYVHNPIIYLGSDSQNARSVRFDMIRMQISLCLLPFWELREVLSNRAYLSVFRGEINIQGMREKCGIERDASTWSGMKI
jgi:hypothetical protein